MEVPGRVMDTEKQRANLRRNMCPKCSLFATCPQFEEQLDACFDAARLIRLEDGGRGRDLLHEKLGTGIPAQRREENANG